MQSDLQQIEKVNEELKSIQDQINDLSTKKHDKSKELLDLVLSNKEIICEAKWIFVNEYQLKSFTDKHKMLANLLQNHFHCHLENKDFFLSFVDNEIYLSLNNVSSAKELLKEFQLDKEFLNQKIKEHTKKIEEETKSLLFFQQKLES